MSQDIIQKVKNQAKQLSNLTENLYESEECLKLLNSIDKSYTDKQNQVRIAEILVECNYPAICINLLKHYNQKHIFSNDNIWFSTFYLLRSIWNFTNNSRNLCMQVSDTGFIPMLLTILSNPNIVENVEENEEQCLKVAINILHNIAQHPETKVVFRDNKGTKIIKEFTKINHEQLKVLGYLCLSHIVNEDEISELNDQSGGTIKFILNNLRESYKKHDHKFRGIYSKEYLAGLSKLAVVRDNKFKMIEFDAINIFKDVLKQESPPEEQRYTLNCLWSMSFEEKISETFRNDKELNDILSNVCENTPSDDIRKMCTGVFYTLNNLQKKGPAATSTQKSKSNTKGHIMISYNAGSREMCVKIKDKLKRDGYKVWIDTESIQGSALQSMADAIENACVILACITEKYYQSPNCRLEVEYAVKLNKPMIPIIMQQKYQPQGWLGISIGTKIYYNLATYSIEEKYPSMINEIKAYYFTQENENKENPIFNSSPKKPIIKQSTPPPPPPAISPSNSSNKLSVKTNDLNSNTVFSSAIIKTVSPQMPIVNFDKMNKIKKFRTWSSKDVKDWMSKLNLSNNDIDAFDDVDGPCLIELHDVKLKAPEFFFSLIKEKLTTWRKLATGDWEKYYKLSDFLKFSLELTNLFKEEN